MAKMVTLTIDGTEVTVPEGTLIVDAAKRVGIDIPVFCYHPKMEPVGMCRMCLVEIGRPAVDRATGEVIREADGKPRMQFGPKLETACTTPVTQGMAVLGMTEKVKTARKDVLEFLLTSHPLDCPVCDKGGECPLQNLTMRYGPSQSRFLYDEKNHLAKHVPLGELIYLDRERCIQCSRCVRFQSEIVDEPVIGFYQRGRSLEIVSYSEPGFDSYFSGNTTDICPVGALTTADFRFGARPWEMKPAAGICSHCPVGCNITYSVRREAKSGGKNVIKRILPRQNEAVNEIWMCDKGRFAYHFSESDQRLTQPLVRQGNDLVPASWESAFSKIAEKLRETSAGLVTLASGRLANEDLYNLKDLTDQLGGQAVLYEEMGGGDLVAQAGVGKGTNISTLGKGTVILVVASDLEEEAPIWWLRIRQAARRGAVIIVLNPRPTTLDKFASFSLRYAYGQEVDMVSAFMTGRKTPDWMPAEAQEVLRNAARAFAESQNVIIFYGSEGTGLAASDALSKACAHLLSLTGHIGKPDNGLIAVWQRANTQGAWDMGFRPSIDLAGDLAKASLVYVAGADPAGDDPALAKAMGQSGFVVVQDLFLTETAHRADVVLPVSAVMEREGTFTSGERRVQRFYPAVQSQTDLKPDYVVTAELGEFVGLNLEKRAASLVMQRIATFRPDYAGISYQALAEIEEQWPSLGNGHLYFGGTAYRNLQGGGVQLEPVVQMDPGFALTRTSGESAATLDLPEGTLLAVPVTSLYDRGRMTLTSSLLSQRIPEPFIWMNPQDASVRKIEQGSRVHIVLNGQSQELTARLDGGVPLGVVLAPRSLGIPLRAPAVVSVLQPVQETVGS